MTTQRRTAHVAVVGLVATWVGLGGAVAWAHDDPDGVTAQGGVILPAAPLPTADEAANGQGPVTIRDAAMSGQLTVPAAEDAQGKRRRLPGTTPATHVKSEPKADDTLVTIQQANDLYPDQDNRSGAAQQTVGTPLGALPPLGENLLERIKASLPDARQNAGDPPPQPGRKDVALPGGGPQVIDGGDQAIWADAKPGPDQTPFKPVRPGGKVVASDDQGRVIKTQTVNPKTGVWESETWITYGDGTSFHYPSGHPLRGGDRPNPEDTRTGTKYDITQVSPTEGSTLGIGGNPKKGILTNIRVREVAEDDTRVVVEGFGVKFDAAGGVYGEESGWRKSPSRNFTYTVRSKGVDLWSMALSEDFKATFSGIEPYKDSPSTTMTLKDGTTVPVVSVLLYVPCFNASYSYDYDGPTYLAFSYRADMSPHDPMALLQVTQYTETEEYQLAFVPPTSYSTHESYVYQRTVLYRTDVTP